MKRLLTLLLLASVASGDAFDHMTTQQKVDYAVQLRNAGCLGAAIDALAAAIEDVLNKPVTAACQRAHCNGGYFVTNLYPIFEYATNHFYTLPHVVQTNYLHPNLLSPTNLVYP
jgi:hypothetical protein